MPMIQELVSLSNRLPKESISHDALDYVPVTIDCVIDGKGNFKKFITHEKQRTITERIAAKKGKARLLVDKAEEVLEFFIDTEKDKDKREKQKKQAQFKHKLFLNKLNNYSGIEELSPINSFYGSNRVNGVEKAKESFQSEVKEKQRNGNIAFLILGEMKRLNEQNTIYDAVIANFEKSSKNLKSKRFDRCSVCGSTIYPVADKPHGMIKKVPGKPIRDRAFVSYNKNSFESYGMTGNENSSICSHCAKSHVDALNWLLSHGITRTNEKGKEFFEYKNRKNISEDTAVVFWLRNAVETSLLNILDNPTEDAVKSMFDSVFEGRNTAAAKIETDTFYSITLSGTAARIAVRDWIETSLENLRANLVQWFKHIEVEKYDKDQSKLVIYYPPFSRLVWNIKSKGTSEVQYGRIGTVLWKNAITGQTPPLWLINSVLNRIRAEQGNITPERVSLLQLYLKRKNKSQERSQAMPDKNVLAQNVAYTCGQIFAVLESIQYYAMGKNINAPIRQRFFSSASTMPSTAFGRLCKLAQHHLSKIQTEKPGLAVNLDKKLQELFSQIEEHQLPTVFSIEDQASFSIGYYHQKQKEFNN
jgi:CRISPR-associated protein Csd1